MSSKDKAVTTSKKPAALLPKDYSTLAAFSPDAVDATISTLSKKIDTKLKGKDTEWFSQLTEYVAGLAITQETTTLVMASVLSKLKTVWTADKKAKGLSTGITQEYEGFADWARFVTGQDSGDSTFANWIAVYDFFYTYRGQENGFQMPSEVNGESTDNFSSLVPFTKLLRIKTYAKANKGVLDERVLEHLFDPAISVSVMMDTVKQVQNQINPESANGQGVTENTEGDEGTNSEGTARVDPLKNWQVEGNALNIEVEDGQSIPAFIVNPALADHPLGGAILEAGAAKFGVSNTFDLAEELVDVDTGRSTLTEMVVVNDDASEVLITLGGMTHTLTPAEALSLLESLDLAFPEETESADIP